MIVECGHCGAPLDIKEGAAVITCAYCAKNNRVAGLKTIAPTTPPSFKAPETWKPTDTSEPLPYHPSPAKGGGGKVGLVVLVFIALAIGAIVYACHLRGATVESIAQLPLDSTPEQIEKKYYVTWKTEENVRVTFRSGAAGPYEHLIIRWAGNDFSLPEGMSLLVAEGSTIGPNVLPTISKGLPGGLDASGDYRWGPAGIHVDPVTGAIHINVQAQQDNQPNALRKRQLAALWQIARAAAFGGPLPPSEEVVAVLGGGYPLAKVGGLDTLMPFATARQSIPKLFPGAIISGGTVFAVALDHPLLRAVNLAWTNAANGQLRHVHFGVTAAFRPRLGQLVTCLTRELGPAETRVHNFAEGKQSNVFTISGGSGDKVTLHVGDEANLYINPQGETYDRVAWKRTFEALDRCR